MADFRYKAMIGLGERIKIAADRIGGLDRLADRLADTSRRTLSDWANDKTEPRATALAEIAVITNVDPGWLVVGDDFTRSLIIEQQTAETRDLLAGHVTNPTVQSLLSRGGKAELDPTAGTGGMLLRSQQMVSRWSSDSQLDVEALERAVKLVEDGLEQASRSVNASVKAGMISAAYEILTKNPEVEERSLLRLVVG